ncbi:uncharacterized protein [Drosophila bipectinata]|uniref:uncharacterized protein n=1 Tax=Drosophila bipectinata TaxID=42026 RepID=UPI0038B2988B
MGCLSEKRPISASSPIQNLNSFVDSQGLMRACGRVTSSELLQYDERHPFILPYDCHLLRLLVQFTHRMTLHCGNQLMIRLIRAKFWIPRGIYLEPTSELTTEKYLAAFARAQQQLLWHFTPPAAAHMGGLWEAGVKSFKTLFYKSTATRKYTFEELATFLAKIEACLNSRPLAPMSENPADLLALTPGHFLVGGPLLDTVEPEIKGDTTSIINRWQHLKALQQQFRLRWKEEYLNELHKRNKWQAPTRDLRVGDMVVIKEDNLPSNEWHFGRVDAVYPGSDGHVRMIDIRTARELVKRPVAKVVLLPLDASAYPQ